jgi:hypothetical protein
MANPSFSLLEREENNVQCADSALSFYHFFRSILKIVIWLERSGRKIVYMASKTVNENQPY